MAVNTGLPENRPVRTLAIDPQTPTTIYAQVSGVFKSTDGGASSSAVDTELPIGGFAVAIDPQTPSTVYAGGQGVFKSTDGATTWSALNPGLPDSIRVTALAVDPQTPTTLYAGISGGGVFAIQQTSFNSIPHFDTTIGQWATGVAVANVGTADTTVTVEAFDSSGASLGTTTLTISANGRAAFDVGATFGAGSGWLKLTADQPLAALEVFTNLQSGAIAGLAGVP